jgi:CubicO group peptidase (beta-lactamase class C family)
LLSHQAGLAIEWPVDLDDADDDEALQRLAAREPERLPVGPGELFSYCNTGFWFVGAGIARANGSTFEQAMSDRVLGPLGLTATSFETPAGVARGHEQVEPGSDEHNPVDDAYPRVRRPSGGLWSTVGDLLAFGAHHLGEPGPLTRESVLEMQRPLIPVPGGNYGLGWFLLDRQEGSSVEHTGSAAGYESLLVVMPEARVVFAALTNSSRGSAAIRDVLQALGLGQTSPPRVDLSADELNRFTGRYEGQGIRIAVSQSDGGLDLELAEFNPFTSQSASYPPVRAHSVGAREFEVSSGEWAGDRFDFPRDGFVRTYVLAQRVE